MWAASMEASRHRQISPRAVNSLGMQAAVELCAAPLLCSALSF